MPTIVDEASGLMREVSETDYQRLRQAVGSGLRDRLTRVASEPEVKMRLWDAVDGTWTVPIPEYNVRLHLREVVFKCSACNYTSIREGEVASHVRFMRERSQEHIRAKLIPMLQGGREMSEQCTGCNNGFQLRKQQGKRHLADSVEAGRVHSGAVNEVTMHRFSVAQGFSNLLSERLIADALPARNGRTRAHR